jgi:methylenetetrahydromethanopterin dehydrogenase
LSQAKIGVFKCGNIATAPLLDLLPDELADRKDLIVRSVSTGSKMDIDAVDDAIDKLFDFAPDLVLFISPNTTAPGPAKARDVFSKRKIPTVVITDSPGKKAKEHMKEQGLGYLIILGDPLIGARKEFLDPVEMAIFNSNVIKILATTGVFRLVFQEIDKLVFSIKNGKALSPPRMIVDTSHIRDSTDFKNPYARVKAMAAYELLKKVAEINVQGCFIEKDKEKYIPLVACAHEIVQAGAKLAEEAREIEKYTDSLLRTPHGKDGRLKTKTRLLLSPEVAEETAELTE